VTGRARYAAAERELLETLLSRVSSGRVLWEHEDGRVVCFGRGEERAHVLWSDRATRRTLESGTIGFCDGYVEADWRLASGTLLGLLESLVSARLNQPINARMPLGLRLRLAAAHLAGHASRARTHEDVRSHYDLDAAFYALWLDETMTYTCGVARAEGDDLETMQRQKLDLVLDKLGVGEGDRLLDLGCGWGSLALRAARERGAHVTAVNVSRPQLAWLEERVAREGLGARVRTLAGDLREAAGTYDRVAAVGVAEHLGRRRLGDLFDVMARCLRPGGSGLVHTIASATTGGTDPWIERRIFPGSFVPTLSDLVGHASRAGLRVVHVEDLGPHYALTLRHWLRRFEGARPEVVARFGERFARTWEMYLAMLVPTFEHLSTCVVQIVVTKGEGAARGIRRVGAKGEG
jgi:cyclopropane-fatty-acyl-phospholipid synthase